MMRATIVILTSLVLLVGLLSSRVAIALPRPELLSDDLRHVSSRAAYAICVDVDGDAPELRQEALAIVRSVLANELRAYPSWQLVNRQRPIVAAGCPGRSVYLESGGRHPRLEGGALPRIVSVPSPFVLHVYVTSSENVSRIFGAMRSRVAGEEMFCPEALVCAEVTKSLFVTSEMLSNPASLGTGIAQGLGLISTRDVEAGR